MGRFWGTGYDIPLLELNSGYYGSSLQNYYLNSQIYFIDFCMYNIL